MHLAFVRNFQFTLLLVLAGLVSMPSAQAGIKFWTGAVNGNFNNAGNWSGGTPVAGDDLIFQANALVTRLVATNDFSPNRAFNTITFHGSNYVIRGSALLVTNGISSLNSVGPNTVDADAAEKPTRSEVRAPHRNLLNTSRPKLSVPMRNFIPRG